jgi:hypothetical protein
MGGNKMTLTERVESFFIEHGWSPEKLGEAPVYRMQYRDRNGEWACLAIVEEDNQQFLFYSICPANALEHRRSAMLDYLNRLNVILDVGNFQMDMENGEIRFRTSIDAEGEPLSSTLIKNLVYMNVLTMNHYLPGLIAVNLAGEDPEEVIKQQHSG